jgi:RNA polymerase sigma-70 factor (ECF subfamily)
MANLTEITKRWIADRAIVAAFISSAVPDFHDCQDILQEVAVAVLEAADAYDSTRPFIAWALAIARNRIIDFRRRKSASRVGFDSEVIEVLGGAFEEIRAEAGPMGEALSACLKGLALKSIRLLEMRYHRSLKSAQIARQVGAAAPATQELKKLGELRWVTNFAPSMTRLSAGHLSRRKRSCFACLTVGCC